MGLSAHERRAPTGCRPTVSGSISLPFRGSFHRSLTVLVHYRSLGVFSLTGWSPQIHTGHPVPGATRGHGRETPPLSPTGLLPSTARLSRHVRLAGRFVTPWQVRGPAWPCPTTPHGQRPRALAPMRFRLFPFRSPLLGESRLLSFPPATKMIQFAGFPPRGLCVQPRGDAPLRAPGFPIRASPGQRLLAPRRGTIVACHALHRPPAPRHPPWALIRLAALG